MKLRYVPPSEFERLMTLPCDRYERSRLFADMCRINTLYMIMRAGSGHVGSSFSSLDIVSWIHLHEVDGYRPDLYFSSKGHDAPGLYAVLTALGRLDFDLMHRLRQLGGLPGHPDVSTPGSVTNTGSLGMGISKAKGMAEAARLDGERLPIFVLTGDGELQEGQIWESLQGAANRGLGEVTVIVDHNKVQSDTWVTNVSDLGNLEAKFAAFGWRSLRCDGHDLGALEEAMAKARKEPEIPFAIIADTVKGKGVSFMEGIPAGETLYQFHSGAPSLEHFDDALDELLARCDEALTSVGAEDLRPEVAEIREQPTFTGQRLVAAYSKALIEQAQHDDNIVVLDGDLILDCGLIPFADRYAERFIECGIAEQDMVSQAGGLALRGRLPIVHSFASFLSSRAAEQIYTNATEQTKIVYVGSLAGVVPGGPGHSHQAVNDIARFACVPGLLAVEPSHEAAVAPLLEYILQVLPSSVYFRLVSTPVDVPFPPPQQAIPVVGHGTTIRPGSDGVIFGAGPVMLSEAFAAAELLATNSGIDVRVIDLPWLNRVDPDWLAAETEGAGLVLVLDNHYPQGGQGQMLMAALASISSRTRVLQRAVESIPACGRNDDVLRFHGLDRESIAGGILAALQGPVR